MKESINLLPLPLLFLFSVNGFFSFFFYVHIVRIVLYNHNQHLNEDINNKQSLKS